MYSKDLFKAVTDERLVIDVVAPGFNKDTVTVKSARVNGGEAFKITVEGHYVGHKNGNGDPVPAVAFEKKVQNFKYVLSDDTQFGDELFRSKAGTFTSKDYDLDKMVYSVADGVIRISIPKTDLAKGAVLTASDNADEASSGVTGATPAADPATADDAEND